MPMTQEQIDYQYAHRNEDRGSEIINVHVILMVFAVVGVTLRFISRKLKAGLGIDDWMMLVSLVGLHLYPSTGMDLTRLRS